MHSYQRSNRELWLSFIAIVGISFAYLFMVTWVDGIPKASDFFGHMIGVLGFILMLMTETLYSLRKRSRNARWGRMASWLDFHIFTGLVGPFMVLLHSSWKFNGLAGVVTLLTAIVVISGFIGRYIYTAAPRSADGAEIEARELEAQIAAADADLQRWLAASQDDSLRGLVGRMAGDASGSALSMIFGRSLDDWRYRARWRREKSRLPGAARARAGQLEILVQQRRELQREIASLAMARRLLALWHAVHIPIGMALFTAAFIHIIAAFYYATLLR
jgi:hypothetical protein